MVPKIWLTYIKLARATKKLAWAKFLHASQIWGTTSNNSSSRYFKGALSLGSFPISVVQQFSKNGKDPYRKVDKQSSSNAAFYQHGSKAFSDRPAARNITKPKSGFSFATILPLEPKVDRSHSHSLFRSTDY